MKQEIHPIIQNAALIEKQGIAVFENVTRMPTYGEPIVLPYHEYGIFITFSLNIAWILQKKQYLCTQIRRAVFT